MNHFSCSVLRRLAWPFVVLILGVGVSLAAPIRSRLPELPVKTPVAWIADVADPNGVNTVSPGGWLACGAPYSLYTDQITSLSARLNWNNAIYTGVTWDVQYRVVGAGNWTTITGIGQASYKLTGLLNNTTYEWQVRTVCTGGELSAFSPLATFTTQCQIPGTPLYATDVTSTSAKVGWFSFAPDITHTVQYRVSGVGSWTTVEGISGSTYTLTGLTNGSTYEWQVKAVCSPTESSAFTASNTFTTQCSQPTGLYSTYVAAKSAQLNWSGYSSTAGVRYDVQWRAVGATTWTTVPNLTTPSYSLTGLTTNTPYEWRARTLCSAAENPAYTAPVSFTTQCVNTASSTSTSDVFTSSAKLNWFTTYNYSTTETYTVRWKPIAAVNWNTVSPATSPYSATGLTTNTTYEWQVANVCSSNQNSTFTSSLTFTTGCKVPTFPTTTNVSATQARLNWNSPYTFGIPVTYELRWRQVGAANWTIVSNLATTTYLLTGLTNGINYEWQVKTLCSATESSDNTALASFLTQCTVPASPGISNLTSTSVRMSWSGPSEGVSFELNWRVQGAATWNTVSDIAATFFDLEGLVNATTYEWQVRTICPTAGGSAFTAAASFLTQCTNLSTSFYATNLTSTGAFLNWNGPTEGVSYDIRWRAAGTVNWNTVGNYAAAPGSFNNVYKLTELTNATTYEWQVRTVCADGQGSAYGPAQTFTTQCSAPTSLYTYSIIATAAGLGWSGYSFDSGVPYEVNWRTQGATEWNTITVTNTSYYLSGLTAGTTYEWRVRALCSSNNSSAFSNVATFVTASGAGGPCVLPTSAGTNNILPTAARFFWNNNNGSTASTYEVRYRVVNTANWTVVSALTNTYYDATDLTNNTTYEWQVRALCSGGSNSDFTASATFLTQCAVPNFLSTNSITAGSARFTWGNNSSGGKWEVRYRPVNTATWTVVSELSSTFYDATGLTTNTTYEWQVRTICSPSANSEYTVSTVFTTVCLAPNSPKTIDITASSAELDWTSTGDGFEVRWRPTGSPTWTTTATVAGTEYSLAGLTADTQYEWQVRQLCGGGTGSTFSVLKLFRTRCSTPANPTASGLTSSAARLSWTGSGDSYEIQWRIVGAAGWNTTGNFAGTQYTLTGLTDGTVYEWQVRTVCSATANSVYTTPSTFQTGCRTPASPSTDATSITAYSARLTWIAAGGDQTYEVRYRIVGAADWTTVGTIISGEYLLGGLANNTTYEWQVRAVCSAPNGSGFSGSLTFQTRCLAPTFQSSYFITSSSARLSWGGLVGSTYELQWRPVGNATWNSVSVTNSIYDLLNLTNGVTYEWRVRTICSPQDNSAFTGPATFATQCGVPTSVNTFSIGPSSATLSWFGPTSTSVPGLTITYEVNWRAQGSANWTVVGGITTSSYALTGLTAGTTYEWRVRMICAVGDNSAFAPIATFKAQCTTPVPTISVSNVSAGAASLSWFNSSSATYTPTYDLRWRAQGTTSWTTISNITSSGYFLSGLANNTRYEAQVQGICSDGQRTAFSAAVTFKTQCKSPTDRSTTNITSTSARLNWSGASNGSYSYELRWRPAGSVNWTIVSGVTAGYALTTLTNNTLYEWQLRTTCNASDATIYTASQFFRTRCSRPTGVSTTSITGNTAQLNWTNTGGGTTYEVRWRMVGSTAWNSSGSVTGSSYALTGLDLNTQYEWQVRTLCSDGQQADYSSLLRFTTTGTVACTSMYTLKDGAWNDSSVWSCSRVPTSADLVQVKHLISLPASYVGDAKKVSFDAGAKILFGVNARLRVY